MRPVEPAVTNWSPHFVRILSLLLIASLIVEPATTAWADEPKEDAARQVTTGLVEGAYEALASKTGAARADALKIVIGKAFAFDVWERFLVGERGLSEAELTEFRALLPGFLAQLYADQFGKGLEEAPEIGDTREVRRDILVGAAIPRAEGGPLPVEYRVRDFADRGPLVIDVMVGGISFLVLKRDEFAGILSEGGTERLLAFMRENSM